MLWGYAGRQTYHLAIEVSACVFFHTDNSIETTGKCIRNIVIRVHHSEIHNTKFSEHSFPQSQLQTEKT